MGGCVYDHEGGGAAADARRNAALAVDDLMRRGGRDLEGAKLLVAESLEDIALRYDLGCNRCARDYREVAMNMEQAVAERREVLMSADLRRWCKYKLLALPAEPKERRRLEAQMHREIAECPYVPPTNRAASRVWLKRRGKRKT